MTLWVILAREATKAKRTMYTVMLVKQARKVAVSNWDKEGE